MKVLILFIGTLLISIKLVFSTLTHPTYNFGNKQNNEIDLLYNHLLGQNIYSIISAPNGLTQFSTTLYPDLSLKIHFKMYTNNTKITRVLDENRIIFMGIDLNITNTDIHVPYNDYRTDIIGCKLTKEDARCFDYVYQISTSTYKKNINGDICKNSLTPLGFANVQVNILKKNVINFDQYYSILFEKIYPNDFDNITLFNWINYVAADMDHYVNIFYGLGNDPSDFDSFKKADMLNYTNSIYEDGAGLVSYQFYLVHVNWIIALMLVMIII